MDIRAATVGTFDLSLVDVGDVVELGEFLVAVCTMEGVLGHGVSPRQHDSADPCRRL